MRKLMILATTGALAACGNPAEDTDEVVADDTAVIESNASDGAAGVYEITLEDGTVITQTVNADGTFEDVANGEVMRSGTWRAEGEQMCFDPEGDEAEECYSSSAVGADGSFQAYDGEGNVTSTVRRVGDAPGM